MNPDQMLIPSPDVISQEVAGETVLLDLARETYFGLDEVGSSVWRALQAGASARELVAALLDEYEVEPSRLEADVNVLLRELFDENLIADAGSQSAVSLPAAD